jgi:rod shape-determining protein MreC
METLIRFFIKNSYTFLFIFLEILAFNFIISNNNTKKQQFASSANSFTGYFQEKVNKVTDFLDLEEQNKILFEQIRQQNKNSSNLYKYSTAKFQRYVDSTRILMFDYIDAEVIRNSIDQKHNNITLNVGSKQGVETGMAVIAADGAVGVVRDVSKNFCVVVSLLNIDLGISGKLLHDNHFGSIQWNGDNDFMLYFNFIPNRVAVSIGDTVVTSGYSFLFPKNIPIGTITEVKKDVSTSFYILKAKPCVSFSSLNRVWVVKNELKNELDSLQSKSENEN